MSGTLNDEELLRLDEILDQLMEQAAADNLVSVGIVFTDNDGLTRAVSLGLDVAVVGGMELLRNSVGVRQIRGMDAANDLARRDQAAEDKRDV